MVNELRGFSLHSLEYSPKERVSYQELQNITVGLEGPGWTLE